MLQKTIPTTKNIFFIKNNSYLCSCNLNKMFFYKIVTGLYFFAIKIASLFNIKAKKMIVGRKNWRENLMQQIEVGEKYFWIHLASLGEFEQGRPLIEKIKKENPAQKIIISFFSPSGYEIRKNYPFADIVCYLPFDTKKNAKDFIEIVNPKIAVFVKYEFWCFMINELNCKNIPIYLVAGIFRENQFFFKKIAKFYLENIKKFTFFFLQDNNSKTILNRYNINNVCVCGDTRNDRVLQIASEVYENHYLEIFSKDKQIVVCGSTWRYDEKILVEYINKYSEKLNFIIAPHELCEKNIKFLEVGIVSKTIRYSNIQNIDSQTTTIIIDNIGLLSKLYRYAKFAYIGGGFGRGIHNTLEAAVYNIPIIFGPNYKKFKEACHLVEINVAFPIKNFNDFEKIANKIFLETENYKQMQINIKEYFFKSVGATDFIYKYLYNL